MMKFSLILGAFALSFSAAFAQTENKDAAPAPKGWHLLDKSTSGYYGISVDKAYEFLKAKKLKSKTVLVAVIDSGIDTLHEDLKPVMWKNPKEIPGNKKDDDKNGYVDDVYGWNFIGGKDGRNVKEDSYEAARVYHKLKKKYGSLVPDESSAKNDAEKAEIALYKKAMKKVVGDGTEEAVDVTMLEKIEKNLKKSDSVYRQL